MNNAKILDCTLRDGGYCNEWLFGKKNISKIIKKLDRAGIDIIECGFLTNKNSDNDNLSRFKKVQKLKPYLSFEHNAKLVLMANHGEYDFGQLPDNDGIIDGIRLAFHKDDCESAFQDCAIIKEKGYQVFVQPMVSIRYTEEEFITLIKTVNKIQPYAFYIVDSFGSMKKKQLESLYAITEKYLSPEIAIGFHAHNNMQLARVNAEWLLEYSKNERNIIIDSCVCGMGRGAGNLNTELIAEDLNLREHRKYQVRDVLEIVDEVILGFYEKKYWGYSLPNFISAKYNVHPNYAEYLESKKTLTFNEMCEIFEAIPAKQCYEFDREYIKKVYLDYLENHNKNKNDISELKKQLQEKQIMIIAPGRTVYKEKNTIDQYMQNHDIVKISVNFVYENTKMDYVFFSNIRRFKQAALEQECVIATSNIDEQVNYKISYKKYLNEESEIEDNAAIMLIKMLIDCGVKKIYIAGMDGYSKDMSENYFDEELQIQMRSEVVDKKNQEISKILLKLSHEYNIELITTNKYLEMEK